jgi:hypothetical protein
LCTVKSTFTKQPNKHVARCIMAITLTYRKKRWPRYNSDSYHFFSMNVSQTKTKNLISFISNHS